MFILYFSKNLLNYIFHAYEPKRIRSIPEEYVVRQVSGEQLYKNVSDLLPIRVLGGTAADLSADHVRRLAGQRNPHPKNGAAKELFAADLQAVALGGELSLPQEEMEKDLLRVGERLGLRGAAIDKLNAQVLAEMNRKTVETALDGVKEMTLTMVDGDFPREVLAGQNLKFANFKMPSRRNNAQSYDATSKKAGGKKEGVLILVRVRIDLHNFGFCYLVRKDAAYAFTTRVHFQHDPRRVLSIQFKENFQYLHHELHGRVVIVQKNHLI